MSLDLSKYGVGDALPSLTKDPVTQVQLIRYAGASGDFNPIHTVPTYAMEAGLDGTIAHGMLVMGILGQMISTWAGVAPVAKFGVSFKGMTLPGDVLTAGGEVTKKHETEGTTFLDAKVWVKDANGETKVEGKVTVRI